MQALSPWRAASSRTKAGTVCGVGSLTGCPPRGGASSAASCCRRVLARVRCGFRRGRGRRRRPSRGRRPRSGESSSTRPPAATQAASTASRSSTRNERWGETGLIDGARRGRARNGGRRCEVQELDAHAFAQQVDRLEFGPPKAQEGVAGLARDRELALGHEAQGLGVEALGAREVGDTHADMGETRDRDEGTPAAPGQPLTDLTVRQIMTDRATRSPPPPSLPRESP